MAARRQLPLVMLVTGTAVTVMTQVFFNQVSSCPTRTTTTTRGALIHAPQAAIHPSTHVLAWVKYVSPLIVDLARSLQPYRGHQHPTRPLQPKSRNYLQIIGWDKYLLRYQPWQLTRLAQRLGYRRVHAALHGVCDMWLRTDLVRPRLPRS